jgi:tetratricopeptide (TPR) repeat protein
MDKIIWIEEYLTEAMRLVWEEGHEPALKLLDKLLYEEPGYGRLHNILGIIHLNYADNIETAEMHFRMAIKFNPKFSEPYWYLGQLLCQEDRLNEAISVFKDGLKAKHSNKSGLFANVAKAYELKKKYSKAIRHYKDALSHSAELWNCIALEESIQRCKRKRK